MAPSTEDWAVRRLSTHSFETIWNGAVGEYTANVSLTPIGQRYVVGTVMLGNKIYGLPDGNPYMVFSLPFSALGNNQLLPVGTWISTDQILFNVQSLISVYANTGVTFPRNLVYLYHDRNSQIALVAVQYSVASVLFPNGLPGLYLTTYRNPIVTNPIQSWSFVLPTPINTQTMAAMQTRLSSCLASNTPGTLLTINGYDTDPTLPFPNLTGTTYVDILLDPSILTSYDAEVLSLNTGYISLLYNETRDILHCPKGSNPNNWILTHEASYVSIWNSTTRSGVRVPRLDPFCIEQLTHADWSIGRNVITALQTSMNAISVIAHVRVRQPANPHTLQPNSAFLQSLYECNDNEIMLHFLGRVDSSATFWLAANLEQNPYITLMFSTPQDTDNNLLTLYRNALGYHDMAAVLGGTFQPQMQAAQSFVLTKPAYLYSQSCYALVYTNGRLIDTATISQLDLPQGKLGVSISNSIPITIPSTIDVAIVENAAFLATTLTVTTAGTATTIRSPYASVYQYVSFNTALTGWDHSSITGGYVKVAPGPQSYNVFPDSSGIGYDIVVMPGLIGETLLIIDDIYVIVNRIDLDPLLSVPTPLIFTLTGMDAQNNPVPLLNIGTIEVYINGLRLAHQLDYNLLSWQDSTSGGIGRIDLVVSNQSYFNPAVTGNRIEIVVHSSIQTSTDVAYVLGQTLRNQVKPSFYNPILSRVFVEGVLLANTSWHTDWISVNTQPEGGVGFWDTMMHRRVYELLTPYTPQTDYTNLAVVERVLNNLIPSVPTQIVLQSQHQLYSVYLSVIIADVIAGRIILIDDPDPRQFLKQFALYQTVKNIDPVLATYQGLVNPTYIALSANYTNYTITAPESASLIQRLISFTLTPSVTTLGETLI